VFTAPYSPAQVLGQRDHHRGQGRVTRHEDGGSHRTGALAHAAAEPIIPEDNDAQAYVLLAITCFLFHTVACALTVLEIVGWHLDWALPAVLALLLAVMVRLGWHWREEYKQVFLMGVFLLQWLLRNVAAMLTRLTTFSDAPAAGAPAAGAPAAGAPAAGAPAADADPDDPPEYVHDDFAHNPAEAPPPVAVPPENGVQMGAVPTRAATGEEEWS
jgi:hypothetical protein